MQQYCQHLKYVDYSNYMPYKLRIPQLEVCMADDQNPKVFQMRVDPTFTAQLDALRKAQDDLPTRAEMIRRLVEAAHSKVVLKAAKR